jgi:hypothetical protein
MPGVTWPAAMEQIGWRCKDNTYLTMTASQMMAMALTCMQAFMSFRYVFGALKDAVDATTTLEEVEAVDIISSWPDLFYVEPE